MKIGDFDPLPLQIRGEILGHLDGQSDDHHPLIDGNPLLNFRHQIIDLA
jgi:hypothetical protein